MIISIVNQKGGVSKTTSCYNISHILADRGSKVLKIDLDPQASLSSANFDPESIEKNIDSVMLEKEDIRNCIYELKENLYISPSSINLSVAELNLVNEMARETILKNALKKIKDDFDFILIDCPPSLGLLTINALCSSDKVLIPVSCEDLSFRGLELLMDTVDKVKENLNDKLEIIGIIATKFNTITNHSKEFLEILEKKYNVIGIVNDSVVIKDSFKNNISINNYNPKHKTAKQYIQISKILEKEKGVKK